MHGLLAHAGKRDSWTWSVAIYLYQNKVRRGIEGWGLVVDD